MPPSKNGGSFLLWVYLFLCIQNILSKDIKHTKFIQSNDFTDFSQPAILLGQPTESSVTFSVMLGLDGSFWLSYGLNSLNSFTLPSSGSAGSPQFVTINNLEASSRYYYRLNYIDNASGSSMTTPIRSFTTKKSESEAFTFAITADIHWMDDNFDENVLSSSLLRISEAFPDFVIDIGDLFVSEKLNVPASELNATYSAVFSFFADFFHSSHLFLANGNHDGEWSCGVWACAPKNTRSWMAVLRAKTRKSFFPTPVPDTFYSGNTDIRYPEIGAQGDYYAWQWGSVFFVTLDPFWYSDIPDPPTGWSWTLGEQQYFWLHSSLMNSQSKFKLVFIHNLVGGAFSSNSRYADANLQGVGGIEWIKYFEWGGYDVNGQYSFVTNRKSWVERGALPVHQLFVKAGVQCVFKGHDHIYYQDTTDDGVKYVTLPHASMYNSSNPSHMDSKVLLGYGDVLNLVQFMGGYALVDVSDAAVTVTYQDFNGTTLDSFTLAANEKLFLK